MLIACAFCELLDSLAMGSRHRTSLSVKAASQREPSRLSSLPRKTITIHSVVFYLGLLFPSNSLTVSPPATSENLRLG
jgi:hypothetical protein